MKHVRELGEGGEDRTRAGEERGGAGWCGEPYACASYFSGSVQLLSTFGSSVVVVI